MSVNFTRQGPSLLQLNQKLQGSLCDHLGMRFTALGRGWLAGEMPVDQRTLQPAGLLHGGASVALAETLGSMASLLAVQGKQQVVGVEVNANHLRPVTSGRVNGVVRPLQVGRLIHVWLVDIRDDQDRPICSARLTAAVLQNQR